MSKSFAGTTNRSDVDIKDLKFILETSDYQSSLYVNGGLDHIVGTYPWISLGAIQTIEMFDLFERCLLDVLSFSRDLILCHIARQFPN